MTVEAVYQECRRSIAGMLPAMRARNLEVLERETLKIRRLLQSRASAEKDAGDRLRAEQLDAIEGLAESIYDSLCAMSSAARLEMDRIQTAEPLLRHLAADPSRLN
jgi:hypothetical protein